MAGRCGANPWHAGTVAADQWEAVAGALEARAAELVAAWVNGQRGAVLDELENLERPALLTALFVLELEAGDRETFTRMLAARVIS